MGDDVPTIIGPSRRLSHDGLALASGFRLGHYEVVGALGAGGMATVLKARDLELGRVVALKILPPDSARDPDAVTRFKQEARAAAKLDHDNVARVFFCGEEKGLHFIAFEFVEGETLRALIERHGTLPPADCLRYLVQLAAGLQHASDRGVIHRDVKPSNIVVTPDGKAKLIDMGLARQQGVHSVHGGVTQSGMTLGTFDYISPEQALDPRLVDVRSDIYSLGCAFYHALTGRPPVPEGTAAKKLHAHQHEPPTDPRLINPRVPDGLAVILSHMMVKDPARRYASPEVLVRDLLAVADSLDIPLDPTIIPVVPIRSGTSLVRTLTATNGRRVPRSLLLGAAVALASVVVIVLSLGGRTGPKPGAPALDDSFGRPDRVPARILEAGGLDTTPPKTLVKQTAKPANAAQLIEALGQPHVVIQLAPGQVYDLSSTPGAVFAGKELEIETPVGSSPAILKLAAIPLAADEPTALREGALTVRGADAVRFRGVKFLITQAPGDGEDVPNNPVGLLIDDTAKLVISECQFELDGTAVDGTGVLINRSVRSGTTVVTVRHSSVILRRWVGFELAGTVKADFAECGFETSRAALALSGEGAAPAVGLRSCTFLIENRGAALEVRKAVAATLQVGFSVFATGNTDPPGMMMAADPNEPKPAMLRIAPGASAITTSAADQPNAFHRVERPADLDAALDLKSHPWVAAAPAVKLDTLEPWKAFELNPRSKQLLVPRPSDVHILGVRRLPFDDTWLYGTWPPGGIQSDAPPPGVKIWYPNPPAAEKDSLPTDVYDNLALALAALNPGDTLCIRGGGVIEVPKLPDITKPGFRATLRPEDPKVPVVLTPADPNKLDSAMFRVDEGDIRFERIEFRLKPAVSKAGDMKSQSVVALAGGRSCEFHQCVITMDQQKDEILSAVALVDVSAAMRKTEAVRRPVVRMEECVLRGRGRAVWAPSAFPFEFTASNVLAVLAAPFLEMEGPARPPPGGAFAGVNLTRVTALLGNGLIAMRCGKPTDDKPGPFVPVEIRTDGCLFAPVAGTAAPFVLVSGGDSDLEDRYVTWSADGANGYANFPEDSTMVEVTSDLPGGQGKRMGVADWLKSTHEKTAGFGTVTLARSAEKLENLAGFPPEDAAVKDSTLPAPVGCRVKDLPKPSR